VRGRDVFRRPKLVCGGAIEVTGPSEEIGVRSRGPREDDDRKRIATSVGTGLWRKRGRRNTRDAEADPGVEAQEARNQAVSFQSVLIVRHDTASVTHEAALGTTISPLQLYRIELM